MSAILSRTATGSINFPSVNHQLMRGLLTTAKQNAPFLGVTKAGQLMLNQGTNSVRWERFENATIASTALGEDGTPLTFPVRNAVAPTITQINATMAKYGNTYYFSEELDLQSMNTQSANLMMNMGENAGRSLNAIAATEFLTSTNTRQGNGVASDALTITAISLNDIREVVAQLNTQDAMKFLPMGMGANREGTNPIRESYIGICHTHVEQDIRGLTGFVPVEAYGGIAQTLPGEFGALAGVRWVSTSLSTLITDDAGTTNAANFRGTSDVLNDVYASFVVGREAVGTVGLGENHTEEIYKSGDRLPAVELIMKEKGSAGAADPLNEIGSVSWKAWFVAQILNNNWLWEIRTLAVEY